MRVKIVFGYDGEKFNGFQILPNKRTIQGELEKALTKLLNKKSKLLHLEEQMQGFQQFIKLHILTQLQQLLQRILAILSTKFCQKISEFFLQKKWVIIFMQDFPQKRKPIDIYFMKVNILIRIMNEQCFGLRVNLI